jgi:outer membrane biosynthesis protein TonB
MISVVPERLTPLLKSALLHGALVMLLGWSWWHWHDRPAPVAPTLAIEATVVTSAPAAAPVATPAAEPVRPPPVVADREREREHEREQRVADERERQRHAEQQQAAREAEREAADKQAQERKAHEQQQAQQAEAQQHERERLDKQRREAELRASLASEERVNAARASGEQAAYVALIRTRVVQAWKRPPGTHAGLNCVVRVTQVPGGVVTAVSIASCNGDGAVRQSIEDAVYGASPLPTPANGDLFERNLVFNFRPDD